MHEHRLQRLARLTRGVALVGIGATTLACQKDPQGMNGPEPIHTNAPYVPMDAGPTASTGEPIGAPTASASASVSPRSMNGPAPVAKPSASHASTPPRSTP